MADFIADVLDAKGDVAAVKRVADAVNALCARFPVYGPAMRASYGFSPSALGEGRGEGRVTA